MTAKFNASMTLNRESTLLSAATRLFCVLALCGAALAAPVTYTGFTITDGKLGNWQFHNARVTLRFVGDTNNVQSLQIADPNDPTTVAQVALITVGTASVVVSTPQRTAYATFAPNQVFVSLDLGDPTSPPLIGGRGVGFGSFSATAAGGIEPAYPMAIEDGTIDWGDSTLPSPALGNLSLDLQHSTAFSGRAWQCVGFPDHTCPTPTQALVTDKGDFFLYQPYQDTNAISTDDSLQAGFFVADVGHSYEPLATRSYSFQDFWGRKPITYNGFVIADATLGSRHFTAAQVQLSFQSDASKAIPYVDSSSFGFINSVGRARVLITRNGQSISASIRPSQLYVYFDVAHASIGFGSNAGGRGYPLSLTANLDNGGMVENSSVGAVTDIMTTGDAANYPAATAALATDLTNETVLSAGASSCVAFDPVTSVCSNLTPVALHTDKGDFYLFEPYTDDQSLDGTAPYTINWGMFWSNLGSGGDD